MLPLTQMAFQSHGWFVFLLVCCLSVDKMISNIDFSGSFRCSSPCLDTVFYLDFLGLLVVGCRLLKLLLKSLVFNRIVQLLLFLLSL